VDLHAAGRRDLATSLVGEYRAAGGNTGDDALVAWLPSYTALSGARASDAGPDIVRQQSMDALDEVAAHAHVAVRGDGPVALALAAIADAQVMPRRILADEFEKPLMAATSSTRVRDQCPEPEHRLACSWGHPAPRGADVVRDCGHYRHRMDAFTHSGPPVAVRC